MQDIIFYIHITFLCIAGAGILLADRGAMAWLRGTRETVSAQTLFVSHWVVTVGLSGLMLSGLTLFWPERNFLLGEPVFWLKMAFVTTLVINSFFIEHLMHTAARQSFASLSTAQKIPFIVSGVVSTLCWLGAFTAAFFLLG